MKPVISYRIPRFSLDPSACVRKRVGTKYRNFENKKELIDFFENLKNSSHDSWLSITCGCGEVHEYQTAEKIPDKEFSCSCGRLLFKFGNP